MENYDFYKSKIKNILSEKRFNHSVNVGEMAAKLAKVYSEDVNDARIAGLLHDVCKEKSRDELTELFSSAPKDIFNLFNDVPEKKVLHGPAGAVYLQKYFGIDNKNILNGVTFHTTGRSNMSTFEKIIFVADFVSEERQWPEIKELQELAVNNIDEVVLRKIILAIQKCINKRVKISQNTVNAYQSMVG